VGAAAQTAASADQRAGDDRAFPGFPAGANRVFSRFFIDRPIFATVLSIAITLAGGIALANLPIAMYPQIAPPTVMVTCQFPGASAQVVAETVATPIEQQVNGVENMMYMSSQCTNDGNYTLTVTFKHGVDMNLAQVLVQNRVSLAMPLLPDVIKATGVTTKKRSPDILLAIGIYSPDHSRDQLYLSNYALIHLRDELSRLPGVSDVTMFGQRDYSMRIWLDPNKLAVRNMTAGDVVRALREQNLQVAAGQVGQSPAVAGQETQVTLSTLGRLALPEQFGKIIIKTTEDGRPVRVRDVGRVELGAKNQDVSSKVDGEPVSNLGIFQLPDANALATADLIREKIEELKKDFPPGVDYLIRYDTTPFIRESISEVFVTLFVSVALVAFVVLLFLQNWRSAVIPLVAVPVGIVGTFAVMLALGFSLNNLTLFGLVLAIGIVVDDAIVVVEAVEHHIERGLAPRAATIKAMSEVSAPVMAVGLVLSAVFIPCAFISGITGQFFRQFALTIASSTIISTVNSLTLSPALAAILLKPRRKGVYQTLPWPAFVALGGCAGYFGLGPYFLQQAQSSQTLSSAAAALNLTDLVRSLGIELHLAAGLAGAIVGAVTGFAVHRPANWLLGHGFELFNRGFQASANGYARVVGGLLRVFVLVLLVYGGMLCLTYYGYSGFPRGLLPAKLLGQLEADDAETGKPKHPLLKSMLQFRGLPKGFIPSQDMGYLLVNIQLPDSASTERTDAVISQINEIAHATDGINATVGISGQSLILNAYGSNFGTMFITLKEFKDRRDPLVDQIFRWLALDGFDPRKPREQRLRHLLHLPPEKESLYFEAIANKLRAEFGRKIHDAEIAVFGPPPVRGVGRAGGFMIMIEDRGDLGPQNLQAQVENIVDLARKPEVSRGQVIGLTAVFRANVPQIFLDVNRSACMLKGVLLQDVFDTLQVYLGSLYINDFNLFGRTWQVIAQAEARFRSQKDDIKGLRVRNQRGTMVPLGAVADVREINGPLVLSRYNMYPAASINGSATPGISTGTAIDFMSQLSTQELPKAMAYEWTELAYLELLAGNTAMIVFGLSIVMVFLVLAAQFESWTMPLAVILSVPLCILSAMAGVGVSGLDINIFTQIGLVVLVGLASKNAILIVEFAKVIHRTGKPIREATLESCRLRLRPIIMTSMAFILGVIPLLFAHGAGAEMRRSLGMAVFSGMIGVTLFGIVLTPVFFYIIDTLSESAVFANPTVRRVGSIVLLILTFGLPWLWFLARAGKSGSLLGTVDARPQGGADFPDTHPDAPRKS
jgi:multidrug efflux pump